MVTQGAGHPPSGKLKLLFPLSLECGHNIVGHNLAFADGILGRGRADSAGFEIGNPGAVPQGPHARKLGHLQEFIHHDAPSLLLAGQGHTQGMRT